MRHTSISHVSDRSTQLVKGQHIDLAAIFMDNSKAYIIYISEVEWEKTAAAVPRRKIN